AAEALRIQPPALVKDAALLPKCLEQALGAPPLDGVAVKTDSWVKGEATIRVAIGQVKRYQSLTKARASQITESAWSADLDTAREAYATWVPRWYRFISGEFRAARKTLATYLTQPVDLPQQQSILHDITERQSLDKELRANTDMPRLFGVQWRGPDSDSRVLEALLGWVLDLYRDIDSNQLPPGLLDLFSGEIHAPELKQIVDEASKKSLEAIAAYKKVTTDLAWRDLPGGESRTLINDTWQTLLTRTQTWQANLHRLTEYVSLNESRKVVRTRNLESLLGVADHWPKGAESLTDSYLRSYYTGVLREAMQQRPELKAFDRHEHEASIDEFRSLDDFKLRYNRARVRLAHMQNMPGLASAVTGSNLHLLNVQTELKTRHKPIRWIMQRAGEAIQRIKPVFMMSPLSVAIHLPPELPPFDLVIFDEASQVRPEDAMCAIIRAKQSIVVGDTRQMPPTSFFDRVADDEDYDEEVDEAIQEMAKLESILSLMSTAVTGKTRRPDLRWHYRSVHPALIQPSNEMFYGNRLIIFPSPGDVAQGRRIGVVFHHNPNSVYEPGSRKRINQIEADQVAQAVLSHLRESSELSLMVAAMNKTQADLIYDKVLMLERQHPDLFAAFRTKHPHEPLDIKNLENVQGDERDVVYISFTYGRDSAGVIRQQFGPLLRDGGERRLNVLITRARRRCEVFSNLRSDDIRVDSPKPGLVAMKSYLKFAEMGHLDISVPTGEGEESPFEEEVSKALVSHGYEVATQVGCAEFRIDLAVRDPQSPANFLLGIECDGATYHSARSARDRDKLRQRVLEDRGWRIHRIWSHDWWQDRDAEIKRLLAVVAGCNRAGVGEPLGETTTLAGAADNHALDAIVNETPRTVPVGTRPYATAPFPGPITDERSLVVYLHDVVAHEGPIDHDLLILRLRDAGGFGRTGKQLRDYFENLIARGIAAGKIQKARDAYYSNPDHLGTPRDWATAADRKTAYLPDIELEAALRQVISTSFGIQPEPAIKAAYNLLGFKRVTDDALAKGERIITRMIASGALSRHPSGISLASST
ncbi:MAG TPA: DUF3320 domain-containing protein, partial [Fimbriimonas sp.]|nr:DUF3320 domain-containing protein [Fimbriimonas sp.]